MGIVEVVGGGDAHADFHVAAAVDANSGVLDVERFPADVEGRSTYYPTQLASTIRRVGRVESAGRPTLVILKRCRNGGPARPDTCVDTPTR